MLVQQMSGYIPTYWICCDAGLDTARAVPRNVIYKWLNVFPKFLSRSRVTNAFRNIKILLRLGFNNSSNEGGR